jgi:hypothetical protein
MSILGRFQPPGPQLPPPVSVMGWGALMLFALLRAAVRLVHGRAADPGDDHPVRGRRMSRHQRRRRYKDRRWWREHRLLYTLREPLVVTPAEHALARELEPQFFLPMRRGMPAREAR